MKTTFEDFHQPITEGEWAGWVYSGCNLRGHPVEEHWHPPVGDVPFDRAAEVPAMTPPEPAELAALSGVLHKGGWVKSPNGCCQNESGIDRSTGKPYQRVTTWQDCEYRDEHEAESAYLAVALAERGYAIRAAAQRPGVRGLREAAKRLLGVALVKDAATLAALVDLEHEVYGSLAAFDPAGLDARLYPCHVTGMHEPDHHLTSNRVCDLQARDVADQLLAGRDLTTLPRALHSDCYWCGTKDIHGLTSKATAQAAWAVALAESRPATEETP